MVLSEAEAETQLTSLRRQRDALDRAIADLTLYLELGRRLTVAAKASEQSDATSPVAAKPSRDPSGDDEERSHTGSHEPPRGVSVTGRQASGIVASSASPLRPEAMTTARATGLNDAVPLQSDGPQMANPGHNRDPGETGLSEGVLARRYGRVLIDAALQALREAGRPLHAGEILAALTRQGFSLPGHDPIAALNTRLWKRSGPGGPLERMGEAVYALAQTDED